ncbi:MAG: hypothetical protein OXT01_29450, partial [Rhodospirillaceae bacterium]|nr:hypothetical protein [Rhodospirillaceae bacterium]
GEPLSEQMILGVTAKTYHFAQDRMGWDRNKVVYILYAIKDTANTKFKSTKIKIFTIRQDYITAADTFEKSLP